MITLLKIRMTFIKRNVMKSLCTYIIFPLIFICYGPFFEWYIKKVTNNKLILINNPEDQSSAEYFHEQILFQKESFTFSNKEKMIIINNNYSNISDDIIDKCKAINNLTIRVFNNETAFKNYTNSKEYEKETEITLLVEIANYNELKYRIANITKTSLETSSNLFEIDLKKSTKLKGKNKVIGFSKIQNLITYYIQKRNNTINKNIKIQSTQFYNNKEIIDNGISSILNFDFDLTYITLFFGSNLFQMTINTIILWMVKEKENHLLEFLYRQGITSKQNFLSWSLLYLITSIIPFFGAVFFYSYNLLPNINIFLIIFVQLLLTISTFFFIILIQSFLKTVKSTNSIIKLFSLIMMVFSITIFLSGFSKILKFFTMLIPNVCYIMTMLNLYRINNFTNFSFELLTMNSEGEFCFMVCIIYFICLSIIYLLLTVFVIKYQNSGLDFISFIKSPIYGKNRINIGKILLEEETEEKININSNHENLTEKELLNKENNNYLNIKNVTRIYGDLKAVNNFSGEIFPDEIFCLLGHNGAGKTTLIKMISGIEDPDKGDIFIGIKSIITDKKFLFENLGVCTQEDIFFDYLTVKEHLKYIVQIKGNYDNINQVEDFIQNIKLGEKQNDLCSTLSGGQKRKLCVAMALIGNSKLILLDEPTSGIDVIARRELWKFLKMNKKDKIIILTTHSLEEAEFLGDKIGIMTEGKFICSGTSSYLKNKFPCGFNLNLIINNKIFRYKKNELMNELKKIDKSALIKIYSNVIFSINFNLIKENTISEIFNYLDLIKNDFGIEQYTISTTSLEDVFINLNTNEMSNNLFSEKKDEESLTISGEKNIEDYNIPFSTQVKANIKRNLITLWRDKVTFIFEIVSSLGMLFLFSIGLNSILTDKNEYIEVEKLLTMSKIYISTKNKDFLNSSYYDKFKNEMKIEWLNKTDFKKYNEFVSYMLNQSKLTNEKSAIYIEENNNDINIINLYQGNSPDYYIATTNMLINIISEKYYGIIINSGKSYSDIPLGIKSGFIRKFASAYVEFIIYTLIFQSLFTISSYMINTPLKERTNNTKHILYLSGNDKLSYWIGIFVVDILKVIIFIFILFPILLMQSSRYIFVSIIIFMCLISLIFFVYIFTFFVDNEEDGVKNFILFGNILSIIIFYFSIIRIIIYYLSKNLLNELLESLFKGDYIITETDIFPISSILFLFLRYFIIILNSNDNSSFNRLTLRYMIIYLIEAIIYGLFLILIESGVFGKILNSILVKYSFSKIDNLNPQPINNENEEDNSRTEILISNEVRLENKNKYLEEQKQKANNISMTTRIINLTKTFWVCKGANIRAVNKINFGLEENEKFGLLGFNGSGKTTTFKSITQEILYDSGEIYLFGKELKSDFNSMRKIIGYCPQENSIFEYLSVEETLNYYKTLKGINISIKEISEKFGLTLYLKTICKNLSGGNKRKLTFAISIINNPKILLLDEPSTGVDPESRRIMWKNIMNLSSNNNKFNMILSTHSMEEAEILCDTVSWLKNGNFECVGNPEKLKIEFSAGYIFHIKIKKNINNELSTDDNKSYEFNKKILGWDKLDDRIKNNSYYIDKLNNVFDVIKEKINSIEIKEVLQDDSFDFVIDIINDVKGQLFTLILSIKEKFDYVDEISIRMQSLENILTNL